MSKGLLFSGQGAQFVGMGKSLHDASETVKSLYARANATLGWDLTTPSFSGPDTVLTETRICQPALYVHGCAVLELLRERGLVDDIGASCGLSLGELTVLYAAGVYDFETGLKLVAERGHLMQAACDATEGGMASVIGGTREQVAELCEAFDIEIANLNCPGQIVISGEKAKVLAAVDGAKGKGFKLVKPLNVAGAYHSRLMETAREAFREFIAPVTLETPRVPVYTNVTGQRVSEPEAIRAALVAQIVSPVHFEDCLRNAAAENGITDFYECGPGAVLTGLARRTERSINVTAISEFSDLPAH